MKRGTIVLVKFPFTDLSSSKRRPALIVSAKNTKDKDFIVAFITSSIIEVTETDLLFDSSFKDFNKSGLRKNSLIKLNKLATINLSVCSGEMGYLGKDTLTTINQKLRIALDLN